MWPLQAFQWTSRSTKTLGTAGWRALVRQAPARSLVCDSLPSAFLESGWKGAEKGPETANPGGQREAMTPQGGGSPELGKDLGMDDVRDLPRQAVRLPQGTAFLCLSSGGSRASASRDLGSTLAERQAWACRGRLCRQERLAVKSNPQGQIGAG